MNEIVAKMVTLNEGFEMEVDGEWHKIRDYVEMYVMASAKKYLRNAGIRAGHDGPIIKIAIDVLRFMDEFDSLRWDALMGVECEIESKMFNIRIVLDRVKGN